ncbi:hypothetical protein H0H92_006676 [Tricholoma furcatifolium]|nr:hypothetical protein H0H92_006676 [Tricholoma furcatifolium]
MDLDSGFQLLDLSEGTQEQLQKAIEVYEETWIEFYMWEADYCRSVLGNCGRPETPVPNSDRTTTNDADLHGLDFRVYQLPPLDFLVDPPSDGDQEFFTVEDFDSEGNPERYCTLSCSNKEAVWIRGYPRYEFCTPGSRNTLVGDVLARRLSFVPYADDANFNFDEYLSGFPDVDWQKDFPDPDWEMIELEVATRLIVRQEFTLADVDKLRILRRSRIDRSSGLLWDTRQRDALKWTFSDDPILSESFADGGPDIALHLDRDYRTFCPKTSCFRTFCNTHAWRQMMPDQEAFSADITVEGILRQLPDTSPLHVITRAHVTMIVPA